MELIILVISILLLIVVYSFPISVLPLTLFFIGQLMGDIKYTIIGKSISPLGLFFYPAILLLVFKFRKEITIKLKNLHVDSYDKKLLLLFSIYFISVFIPEIYFRFLWGSGNPLFLKHMIFSCLSILFIFYKPKINQSRFESLGIVFSLSFILIVILTLPQAIDFFLSTGGKGLGRFRGYRAAEVIFSHVGMWKLGKRHYLFQVTLPLCFILLMTIPFIYGYLCEKLHRFKRLNFYWVYGLVSVFVSTIFYINQYLKQILYNGLFLVGIACTALLFYRKNYKKQVLFLFVLGAVNVSIALLYDKEIKSFVRNNFKQVKSIIDEDKLFYLTSQFDVRTEMGSYPNRVSLYNAVLKNWYNHCFIKGCGPTGYIKIEAEGGKFGKLRTTSFHSSVVDNFTGYGLIFGLVANSFFIFLLFMPIVFKWYEHLEINQLFTLAGTLYTIVFICLFEEQWANMPHLRFVCLSLLIIVSKITEESFEKQKMGNELRYSSDNQKIT